MKTLLPESFTATLSAAIFILLPAIVSSLLLSLSSAASPNASAQGAQWFKGNIHMHSNWGEGRSLAFAEDAINYYRTNGYNFVSITDHGLLQTDTKKWVETGTEEISAGAARRYANTYGKNADTKTETDRITKKTTNFVRLRTLDELRRQFEQRGKFLIIPGTGLSERSGSLSAHMNALNVRAAIPPQGAAGATLGDIIAANARAVAAHGTQNKVNTMFVLNNPFARYFDVRVETLFALPEVRFFEMGDISARFDAHGDWYDNEKFWDIANAFRIEDGHPALYAVGADGASRYMSGYAGQRWVRVRSRELTADAIVAAMGRGDFYTSCGVVLRDVNFNAAKGELSIAVEPKKGETYDISFVVTRAGFDRKATRFNDPAKDGKPARNGNKYSDSIGVVAHKVSGTTASYTLRPDDLYVRAVVTSSNKKRTLPSALLPDFDTAHTQPVGWQQWQERNKK